MRTYEGMWRLRQFVPCWVVQGICIGILGVVSCLLIGASTVVLTAGHGQEGFAWLGYSVDDFAKIAVALGSVLLVLCLVTLALDITEAVLYKLRKLSPVLVLVSACIKTAIWLGYLFFVIVMAAGGSPSPLDLILGIILVVTSVCQLVLGAIHVQKQRKGLFDRGDYADLEAKGGDFENTATLPRSKTWRESIPAITVTSREWSNSDSEDTDYESYRNSLIEAEARRESIQEPDGAGESAAETQTLASSNYENSTWAATSPPQSPRLTTVLSAPPLRKTYSPADSSYHLDEADLALTGFYGVSLYQGETKRF